MWRDDAPLRDFITLQPPQLAPLLWHDPQSPEAPAMLTRPENPDEVAAMMLARAKSLAATGKLVSPIPDRDLKKRIHGVKVPTLIV